MVRTLLLRFRHLGFRTGKDSDFGTQRLGEFHAHVAETAHPQHAYLVAFSDLEML